MNKIEEIKKELEELKPILREKYKVKSMGIYTAPLVNWTLSIE
jgi:predicted nucleotidyltransferase